MAKSAGVFPRWAHGDSVVKSVARLCHAPCDWTTSAACEASAYLSHSTHTTGSRQKTRTRSASEALHAVASSRERRSSLALRIGICRCPNDTGRPATFPVNRSNARKTGRWLLPEPSRENKGEGPSNTEHLYTFSRSQGSRNCRFSAVPGA